MIAEESSVLLVLAPFSDMVQAWGHFFAWVHAKGAGEDGSESPDGWGEEWSDEIDMTLRQQGEVLWNLCPYTTYPTFSSLPTPNCIFPSTNSSLHWTGTRTFPHSSPMPCSLRQNPIPFLDVPSLFHLSRTDPIRSSTGPLVR